MNRHLHKVIFSKRTGTLVVVAENARSISKGNSSGGSAVSRSGAIRMTMLAMMLNLGASAAWALDPGALPTGANVRHGNVTQSVSGNTMTIQQTTAKAVVNYESFNIGSSAQVNHSGGVMLSRVTGSGSTQINGTLNTSGMVLVNPNGIAIGSTGNINAGSFTASTYNITDENFLNGNNRFERNGSTGTVVNEGTIKITEGGGYVALVGAQVDNRGRIETQGGAAVLASGQNATIKVPLSGKVSLELDAAEINASVTNHEQGVVVTKGGQVMMRAAAVVDVASGVANAQVKQAGLIDTTGATGGRVDVLADRGTIKVTGKIKANSTGTDSQGKPLQSGGVFIGRDDKTNQLARHTEVSQAKIESVGGIVETSAHQMNIDDIEVKADQWLINSYDIEITDNATLTADYTNKISASTISNTLSNGTAVSIRTSPNLILGTNDGNGNILVSSAITATAGDATFSMYADKDITFKAPVTLIGRGDFYAGNDIHIDSNMTSRNGLTIMAARDVNINAAISTGYRSEIGAAQNGQNYDVDKSWMTRTGRVNISSDPSHNAKITYGALFQMHSGKDVNNSRSSISANQLIHSGDLSSTSYFYLRGFENVSLPQLAFATNSNTKVEVMAQNITLAGDITAKNIRLEAAAFNTTTGNYQTHPTAQTPTGWGNQAGQFNQENNHTTYKLNYSGDLLISSGLATGNTGIRKNFTLTQQATTPVGNTTLLGFDTVTIDTTDGSTGISGNNIHVVANNILVNKNINMAGSIMLMAASFDQNNTIKGSLPGTDSYTGAQDHHTGWKNLSGIVTLGSDVKLTANSFNLYSGVLPGDKTQRTDIDLDDKLLPASNGVSRIDVAGYNDVKLPLNINSLTDEAFYRVVSKNIIGGELSFISAKNLRLDAGRFTQDKNGVNAFPLYKQGVPDSDSFWSAATGIGTLQLRDQFTLQVNQADLTSGDPSTGRSNLNFSAIRPYGVADISEVVPYSVARGGYLYSFQGFNTVDLPKHAIKAEVVDIRATTINVYDDVNAGGGNWWPNPFYLSLIANAFTPKGLTDQTTGKVNFNHPTADRKITLRSNSLLSAGTYTPGGQDRGFNSRLTVVTNGGDFNALLGYKQEDYTAGGAGEYSSLRIVGFNSTNIELEPAAAGNTATRDITVAKAGGANYPNAIQIEQVAGATGWITIHNNISATGSMSLKARNGGIRMGDRVATSPFIDIVTGKDSAINTNTDIVRFQSLGGTLVLNEADNIRINFTGANYDPGSIEINARGELVLASDLSRSNPDSSVTLRSDATLGRQIEVASESFASSDLNLNTTFTSFNKGVFGELGGDGLGAVRVDSTAAKTVVPIFSKLVKVEAVQFKVPADGIYFDVNGVEYKKDTVLLNGAILLASRIVALPSALDTVTDNGQSIRLTAIVNQGGYTVQTNETNRYYDANGVAYAPGTPLGANLTVYYKPDVGVASALTALPEREKPAIGGKQLYVVTGYEKGTQSSVTEYQSLGLGGTLERFNYTGSNVSNIAPTIVAGDAPVDARDNANYYGNPLSGASANLNMSGQFYTLGGGSISAPTMFNALATGDGKNSLSGNGWDVSWGTSTLSTSGGALRVFSGPKYALDGALFAKGDAADITIFNNPTTGDFSNTKNIKFDAFSLSSGSGDLVVLGFRDIVVEPSGTLKSSGNVTIGAARDLVFKENVVLGGLNTLTTLIAGGMLSTKKEDSSYNTIKGDRVILTAGGGVDVQTEVNILAGSLQDNPGMIGGRPATGTFKVTALNNLVIGSITNNNVPDLTFDTNAGIQYIADSKLTRHGIWSTPDQSGNYGKIELTAPNIIQEANIAAGSGDQKAEVSVTATTGSITRTAPAANSPASVIVGSDVSLKAATTIGATNSFIHTEANNLKLESADSQYIEEQTDVILAAKTTNNGATTVRAVEDLTVGQAGGLTGVTTGLGNVILAAGFKLAAGVGTGGQIKVAGNPSAPLISTTGQIRLFTGNTTDTGKLGQLDASMNNLYLWAMGDKAVNAQTYTAYAASTSITDGAKAQVMFREKIALAPTLKGLTYTYGDVDRNFKVYEAIKAANTGDMNQNTGAGNFIYESAKFFAETQGAAIQGDKWSSSDLLNANTKGYGVNFQGTTGSNFDLSKASALMTVEPKTLNVTYKAENKVYDGETTAKVAPLTTDILSKDVVTFEQTSAFVSPEVGNNKDVNVTGITLLGADASNYKLEKPTYLTRANIVAEGTDPDASESGSSGSGTGGSGTGGSGTSGSGTSGSGTSGSGTGSGTSTAETNTSGSTTSQTTNTASTTSEPAIRPDTNNLTEPKGTNVAGSNVSNVSVQVAEFEFKLSSADEENACSIDNLENCVCEAPEDEKGAPMEWMEICYPEEEIKKKA